MPRDALANPVVLAASARCWNGLCTRTSSPECLPSAACRQPGIALRHHGCDDPPGWVEPRRPSARGPARSGPPMPLPRSAGGAGQRLDRQVRAPRREFPSSSARSAISACSAAAGRRGAGRTGRTARHAHRRRPAPPGRALEGNVPRLFVIEAEYALAMLRAERDWVLALADDVTSGRLAWPVTERKGGTVKDETPKTKSSPSASMPGAPW